MRFNFGFVFILSSLLLFGIAGCSKSDPPPASQPAANTPAPPEEKESNSQPQALPPEKAIYIATVLDTGVTKEDAENALLRMSGPPIAQTAVMLAAGRLLAKGEAKRSGLPQKDGENDLDYVDRFLATTFSDRTSCKSISDREISERFRMMKRKYDHPDLFRAINLQIICCPSEQAPCVNDEAATLCFQEQLARSEEIFSDLLTFRSQPKAFEKQARDTAATHEQIGVTHLKFAFDYDFDRHDQPGRWAVLDPAILKAVKDATAGDILGPIQSEYGYHVLYIEKHTPKTKRSLADPEVRKEVQTTYCNERLERIRQKYLLDLTKSVKVKINHSELAKFKKEVESKREKTRQSPKRSRRKSP